MSFEEGDTVIFYVNTGTFPLQHETFMKMWDFAKELQPQASDLIEELACKGDAPEVPAPSPPYAHLSSSKLTNQEKLEKIEEYIQTLQYNHTGMQFFDIRKDRPLAGLMDTARKIIDDSLPIKCLEAVILSIYLTNDLGSLERFPIGFKTVSNHNVHRHVVLGVYCHKSGLFGALGTSRRSDLGYKELKYTTLADLVQSFVDSYSTYLHKVKRVRIGMPIPNTNRSYESIQWNGATLYPSNKNQDWTKLAEKQSRNIRIYNSYCTIEVEIKQRFERKQIQQQQPQVETTDVEAAATTEPPPQPQPQSTTLSKKTSLVSLPIKNAVLLSKRKNSSLRI